MRSTTRFATVAFVFFVMGAMSVAWGQTYRVLHSFNWVNGDGANPMAECLTIDGSTLYGTTYYGGSATGRGSVFKMNANGTQFGILHTFESGVGAGGQYPCGRLTLVGSTLYGTSENANDGAQSDGAVFQVNTNGSGFSVVHAFAGSPDDGGNPVGGLTLSGSTFYGTTFYGGSTNGGTVFKVDANGGNYSLLHSFDTYSEGVSPWASMTLIGSTLYGTTRNGGPNDYGTIFKINTDGTGYSVMHTFTGAGGDGGLPLGQLTFLGNTLYGTTGTGGNNGFGTLFKINTDGGGYANLHNFNSNRSEGVGPESGLLLNGSTLYGTTGSGGTRNGGTVFQVQTDGSGFEVLHSFTGGTTDGFRPRTGLALSGSTLYGMTYQGGQNNYGTVYSLTIPVPEPSILLMLAGILIAGMPFAFSRLRTK